MENVDTHYNWDVILIILYCLCQDAAMLYAYDSSCHPRKTHPFQLNFMVALWTT